MASTGVLPDAGELGWWHEGTLSDRGGAGPRTNGCWVSATPCASTTWAPPSPPRCLSTGMQPVVLSPPLAQVWISNPDLSLPHRSPPFTPHPTALLRPVCAPALPGIAQLVAISWTPCARSCTLSPQLLVTLPYKGWGSARGTELTSCLCDLSGVDYNREWEEEPLAPRQSSAACREQRTICFLPTGPCWA